MYLCQQVIPQKPGTLAMTFHKPAVETNLYVRFGYGKLKQSNPGASFSINGRLSNKYDTHKSTIK